MLNNYNRHFFHLLIFLLITSCVNLNLDSDIYGVWKGYYDDNEIFFILNNDSTCTLKYYDKVTEKNVVIEGNYELDLSKKPIPLSIRNISQLNYSLHTIIEFVREDSIRIAEFSPKWRLRPIAFLPGKIISLRRNKLKKYD